MIEEIGKRYERAVRNQRERFDVALVQWPAMLHALQTFAEGGDVPRPVVERAMREVLSLLTLPTLPYLTGTYTPAEFWQKEPMAILIGKCNARLFSEEDLLSRADAARELNVSEMRISRWIVSGAIVAIPVFTKLARSKPAVHHMLLRKDLDRSRLLGIPKEAIATKDVLDGEASSLSSSSTNIRWGAPVVEST